MQDLLTYEGLEERELHLHAVKEPSRMTSIISKDILRLTQGHYNAQTKVMQRDKN